MDTDFTVVIATRNRPALVRLALHSVLAQTGAAFDVIVVNDGTEAPHRPAFDALRAELANERRVRVLDLPDTPTGHGPYRTLNAGAAAAEGTYLCFLDDDDVWTDTGHLAQAAAIVAEAPDADLIYFDQEAMTEDGPLPGPVWLDDLGERLRAAGPPGPAGAYAVDVAALMTAWGFGHLNTTIVRRAFFAGLGGFDPTMRWEGDREFFLRGIDRAACIRYAPVRIGRHHVPRPAAHGNVTTRMPPIAKRLEQFALLDKVARSARHPAIAAYARQHRRYAWVKAMRVAAEARSPGMLAQVLARAPRLLG